MSTETKSGSATAIQPKVIIGYALFIVFIFSLAGYYLFVDYRGLTNKHGIDQAQIAREFSRGNGLTTKFLRPFALYQARQVADEAGSLVNLGKMEGDKFVGQFEDTYHAPLGPMVNAATMAIFDSKLSLEPDYQIYPGDRVISGTAIVLLLCSILIFFLLASRIFDRRIGIVVVTLMVLCDMLWRFTHTGLPTILLLFLFGFALFFLYKAVENQEMGQGPLGWAALAAAFFGLMALSHWIAVWIFFGVLVFGALAFRPRGMAAGLMALVFLAVIAPGLIRNFIITGTIHGDAFYALYNGLGALGESGTMRNFKPDKETLDLEGFGGRIALTSLDQLKNIVGYFGSILAAPVFFISLLHPFRRPEISVFRWAILAMWIFAVIGMALFGLPDGEFDSNQIHILFAPIMSAYGLAMVAILWNRMGVGAPTEMVKNSPFTAIVAISSIGMFVTIPRALKSGGVFQEIPYYPYYPKGIKKLNEWTSEREVIVSDMPWAIAWYGDRTSAWMTKDLSQFDAMTEFFDQNRMPVAGIYFSPVSVDRELGSTILQGENADWAYWILQPVSQIVQANSSTARRENNFRFGVLNFLDRQMFFWSNYNRAERGRPQETERKPEGGQDPKQDSTILPSAN
ncbi:MAG: hypothetical protein ACKO2G_13865 [Verrucomicrobiales bacterium]